MKDLSLREIIETLQSWKKNHADVKKYFLDRIEKFDSKIWAYNYVDTNNIEAASTDSVLAWVPIAIKDIFAERWVLTTGASEMLKDFVPPYDATVIKRLKDAWASSLWKLNMDEFAMGSTTENSALKKTLNPWGVNRVPGGSSWGSAAAVAAGLCPAALGTDTWGSLRQPASFCGVVGFRPSYGRNSRLWVFPMASSFDCPGTITKTVHDAGLLYGIMNGEDPMENTSLPWKDIIEPILWDKKDLSWIKIGIPKEYFDEWLDSWVRDTINVAIEKLKELWAEIQEVSLPMTKYAIAAYYIIVPAEVSTNLSRYDGIRYGHMSKQPYGSTDELYLHNRWEWLWEESQRRSVLWSYVLSAWFYDAYFMKAAKVRTLIIDDFEKAFNQVDVIIWPAAPSVAWEMWASEDTLKMYLADMYTIPSALAGLPGISVPCGFAQSEDGKEETLPVWLQILAPRLEEQKLLQIAHIYEQSAWWTEKMTPPGFED